MDIYHHSSMQKITEKDKKPPFYLVYRTITFRTITFRNSDKVP